MSLIFYSQKSAGETSVPPSPTSCAPVIFDMIINQPKVNVLADCFRLAYPANNP